MNQFQKRKVILQTLLQGEGYYDALAVMHYCEPHHAGTRKDGFTPEYSHQINIATFALDLPDLMYRQDVIATIFGHDTSEDAGRKWTKIARRVRRSKKARKRVARAIKNMTKEWKGQRIPDADLFAKMARDPVASIAKGCDRIHNLSSMVGVFTPAKQREYIREVRELFLPMLKLARRRFPHQARAYEMIKFVLISQITLIESALNGAEA
jgi:(p)ppGpp synthase/HD superfamily hydrolase